jgi:transcriptional regulator with XRE-family HTH domain
MTNIGNKEILAKNLAYYVTRCGKTQRELAEIVGVAPTTFNDWMKAKKYPRIDRIEMLANYFGIQKSDLIEEPVTEKKEKDNDILSDIIVRMRVDDTFFAAVQLLYSFDSEQIKSVQETLKTLKAFAK